MREACASLVGSWSLWGGYSATVSGEAGRETKRKSETGAVLSWSLATRRSQAAGLEAQIDYLSESYFSIWPQIGMA